MAKVFINPGHGQKSNGTYDPGAVGSTKYEEATCVKAIGERLNAKLNSVGISTYLYQDGDLGDVCATANNWGADYFVSIHNNAFGDRSAHGIETWYYQGSSKGQSLAKSIQSNLVAALGLTDRGIKPTTGLYVIKNTVAPAVLAEIGFISNLNEEAILKSADGQEKSAEALAKGICSYLGVQYPKPAPPAPTPTPPSDVTYKVQVGAFSVKENAEKLMQRVKEAGFDVFLKEEKK